jgi:hypothetical protein
MSNFDIRLGRLEQRMGVKQRRTVIYITPNLEKDEGEDTPYEVKISSVLWAHAFGGGSFTEDEILWLREEYGDNRTEK